ncbi:PAAR-like domain-containing protein [Rhizobium leguminosarum]|uniref:PAAR-like domain-containing protein n=1 Tax=Rhizobium leguminosarum TaxID=384 RepID=UPI003F9839F3
MRETISINGLTLCHKHSDGWVRSTLPDVCKSPAKPVPYTNIAYARDLAKGTRTVFSHGGAMNGIKGSEFYRSFGDEPGVGGGVISGVNLHRATWLSWSPNVFMEGRNVTRLTDRMLLNKGNTISAGGYFTGALTGTDKTTADLLCNIACSCKAEKQVCVDTAIKGMPKTPQAGLYSEISFDPAGNMLTHPDGTPMTRMGVPGSRLDIIKVAGGQPVEFIEMKFVGDRFRGNQRQRYDRIAASRGKSLQIITVEKDCRCDDNQQQTQPVTTPQEEGMSNWQKAGVALGVTAAGIGAVACAILEPCGAVALGALGLGTATTLATQ